MSQSSAAPSRVRKAIETVNDAQRPDPITEEEIAALGSTLAWRLLVEPYIPKYGGMLQTPKSVLEAERVVAKVGRIVQLGCFCFQSKTTAGLDLSLMTPRPQIGDYVLFEMYAGQEIKLRDGRLLRMLNDTELVMVVKDPELIKGYL